MNVKKIFIASDHAGFEMKQKAISLLKDLGFDTVDLGTNDGKTSVDYPDFANKLAQNLKENDIYGVLICGTGIGISIAANRHSNVRCALCHDVTTAKLAREHNDANVIAFGGRMIGEAVLNDILNAFFDTEFSGGRHERRVKKLGETK
ncbi:MAG: ribose 5-phosphate isomerase B [Campylobacter sp.]